MSYREDVVFKKERGSGADFTIISYAFDTSLDIDITLPNGGFTDLSLTFEEVEVIYSTLKRRKEERENLK